MFPLQPSDDEQRSVLGDLIFAIQFPTMTLEDFSKNVANTGILTDTEVRGLFTLLTGTKPKTSLPFPTNKRAGMNISYLMKFDSINVIKREVQTGHHNPRILKCLIEITNLLPNEQAYISEIFFCNTSNFLIDDVRMEKAQISAFTHIGQAKANNTGKIFQASLIEKMGEKTLGGFAVCRAVFNESFAISVDTPKTEVQFNCSTYNGKLPIPFIQNVTMLTNEQRGILLNPVQPWSQSRQNQIATPATISKGIVLARGHNVHVPQAYAFEEHPSSFSIKYKDRHIAICLGNGRQWAFVVGLKLKVAPRPVVSYHNVQDSDLSIEDVEYCNNQPWGAGY